MAPPTYTTFIIHIWWETESLGQRRWRGQVQQIPSGETFSFQEPSALWHFIDHWSGIPCDIPTGIPSGILTGTADCSLQTKQMKG